jgi:hypothetical protein
LVLQIFTSILPVPRRPGMNRRWHFAQTFDGSGGGDGNRRRSTRRAQGGLHVVRANSGTSGAIRRAQPREAVQETPAAISRSSGLQHGSQIGTVAASRLGNSNRDGMIDRAYPLLCDDLVSLTPDRLTPLVLIKENVCRILEPKLVQDEFRVLNGGIVIPFPSHGHQKRFHEKFGMIIKSAGI